jgi:predicted 3-demethylubiquinone-9 3-methyltransferase (glyoxalase superfamily)
MRSKGLVSNSGRDAAKIERLANEPSAVPEAEPCGCVKDRYGMSWQIVPRKLPTLLGDAAKGAFEFAPLSCRFLDILVITSVTTTMPAKRRIDSMSYKESSACGSERFNQFCIK